MTGPLHRYDALVADGALDPDPEQRAAAARLQELHEALGDQQERPSLLGRLFGAKAPPPRGVYLWGGVGRGKSLLMDILFNNAPVARKRRVHFHAFMLEVHERVGAYRKADEGELKRHPAFDKAAPNDPMPLVAADVAETARLFCFDEFHVTDIADAMILGRLLRGLLDAGAVVVATSNRAPDDLYKDGLNRQLFLPTIDLIKERLDVIELDAAQDYRLARLEGAPTYYAPLGPDADAAMDAAWSRFICGATAAEEMIEVQGRTLHVPAAARDAARFDFEDLCAKPLGAADYLAIADAFSTVFIDRIPEMGPEKRNEAKRFVTLIDTLYETRTKLVCSAAAPPEALYASGDGAFEFERTASRLIEMRSADYLGSERRAAAE
ncbi:MAG: cell division protein ZapE [Pseudomonadota bacterium]